LQKIGREDGDVLNILTFSAGGNGEKPCNANRE
jgi:hypothetical protein